MTLTSRVLDAARHRLWLVTGADKAAALACYLQCICRYLREEKPFQPAEDDYLVYTFNRFQACRFGLDGEIVDPKTKERHKIRDDILRTLACVDEHALDLRALNASNLLRDSLFAGNDAAALRQQRRMGLPLPAVVEWSTERWMG